MTTLLYLNDSTILDANASILDICKLEHGYGLVLDQTPFYPEGGGQPADHGTINGIAVSDVQLVNDQILHVVDEAHNLSIGQSVQCSVNPTRRQDLTIQHSAQHLLSATAYHLFDAKTVGFHLSETYTTIDLDKKLNATELKQMVQTAFERISENMPVAALFPDEATLDTMPLRKVPKVDENIRVVTIGTYDYSPCGGTHVKHTGEIIGMHIHRFENYKGGTRIYFVAGHRFLNLLSEQQLALDYISQKLSTTPELIVDAFDKREQQFDDLKLSVARLSEQLVTLEVNSWLLELEEALDLGTFTPLEIRQFENRDLSELKRLSQQFVEKQEACAICLTNVTSEMTQFIFARPKTLEKVNCKALLAELTKSFAIKGGGAPNGVQGSLVNPLDTDAFIQMLEQQYNMSLETN